ncbi:type II toxin-antitoxin system RelE/ParE family toxin [Brucella sp. HL-2]|nr:type II toxin-antitoxin system RelE/ParE family toxin [Brucella sp. HL-2]MCV9910487.1 type II toxin-antitoxin system RelE/ParE family toxin [Brucella sp. HL-2]
MKLVWLTRARADRTDALNYIAEENPRAALSQLDEIERQTDILINYPDMGRVGRHRGTRELIVNRTPFVIVYRVRPRAQRIEILRLLHGARQWPPV